MIGGLLLITSGCSLLLYYRDNSTIWARNIYDITFLIGLILIIVAAVQTIIWFMLS